MKCKFCGLDITAASESCKVPRFPDSFDYAHRGCWVLWSGQENLKQLCSDVAFILNDISIPSQERIKLAIRTYECSNYKKLLGIEEDTK